MKLRIARLAFLVFVSAIGISTASAQPPTKASDAAPVKTIYLAPDDHTDYFWTADDVQYRAVFIETLDYYLDRIEESADQPLEYQPKWNCDGSLWLWEYEHHKTKQEFERLMARVADGHISSPLNALVSTYGGQPAEAVLRGMYYAGDLERRFDVRFPLAVAMENQTLPLGLGALWSGAGAKYSWRGICGCATKMPYAPFQKRNHEIYWWRGLDDSRILMKWYSLGVNNESLGGYAEARKPDQAIDFVNSDPGFLKRHPYATVGLFGQGWDDLKTLDNSFPAIARRRTTDDQKVIVSNEEDFFRSFERRHGGDLPVLTEAYGNEWDVLSASMAEQTARVRRSVERLRTAEAIAAIVHRHDANFWPQYKTQRDLAHLNLGLYWEHDWTADSTELLRTKRAAWQKRLADQISNYVDRLLEDAKTKLATLVHHAPDRDRSGQSDQSDQPDGPDRQTEAYLIFNPLGWQRDAVVEIDRDFRRPLKIADVNTKVVLDHHRTPEGKLLVRVKGLPPVGFTTIEISAAKTKSPLGFVQGNAIEDSQFKVKIDGSGEISSVIDKSTGRELVGPSGFNRLMRDGQPVASQCTYSIQSLGLLGQRLTIRRFQPIKSQTTITLNDGDGIQIENRILQNFSETLSWNFDVPLRDFELEHEEVGAIVKADLVSNGGHYANRNARYDWLSAGHFVNLTQRDFRVDIANHDCSFFKFGQSTPQKLDTAKSQVQFLIGGQIDGPKLGIPNQNGDETFTQRFSVGTTQLTPASKTENFRSPMAWAQERTNPAIAVKLNAVKRDADSSGPLPTHYALIDVQSSNADADGAVLWAIKPAEDGCEADVVARWWNVSNHDRNVFLKCDGLKLIQPTTHIETDWAEPKPIASGDSNQFTLPFSKHQMRTFRFKFAASKK